MSGPRTIGPAAGRGLEADHPDNLRMEGEAIAGLHQEDREQAEREDAMERLIASAPDADDGFDRYDRREFEWLRGIG